jgi:prepilin peptidase CpaA
MPFFLLGGMGAGDVKLLAGLGAWMGPVAVLWVALYASLAGGALAVVVALGRGYLRTALTNVKNLLTFWVLVGPRPMPELTLERGEGPRLAYAVPIFVGALVTLWLR